MFIVVELPEIDLKAVTAALDSDRILTHEHGGALIECCVSGFVCTCFWECKGYYHTYVYSAR